MSARKNHRDAARDEAPHEEPGFRCCSFPVPASHRSRCRDRSSVAPFGSAGIGAPLQHSPGTSPSTTSGAAWVLDPALALWCFALAAERSGVRRPGGGLRRYAVTTEALRGMSRAEPGLRARHLLLSNPDLDGRRPGDSASGGPLGCGALTIVAHGIFSTRIAGPLYRLAGCRGCLRRVRDLDAVHGRVERRLCLCPGVAVRLGFHQSRSTCWCGSRAKQSASSETRSLAVYSQLPGWPRSVLL